MGKQLSVVESFKGRSKYDKSSPRYLQITKALAIFIGSTNVANSIIENDEFRSLVKVLDSRYPMPGRTLIGKELDKVLATLKQNVEGSFHQHVECHCVPIYGRRRDSLQVISE